MKIKPASLIFENESIFHFLSPIHVEGQDTYFPTIPENKGRRETKKKIVHKTDDKLPSTGITWKSSSVILVFFLGRTIFLSYIVTFRMDSPSTSTRQLNIFHFYFSSKREGFLSFKVIVKRNRKGVERTRTVKGRAPRSL